LNANPKKFRLTFQHAQWLITNPEGTLNIKVDAAVVNADVHKHGRYVEGEILSVHGISQDDASQLTPAQLRTLGVGAQYQATATRRGPLGRLHLSETGTVMRGRQ
jgi:hypothetical protein